MHHHVKNEYLVGRVMWRQWDPIFEVQGLTGLNILMATCTQKQACSHCRHDTHTIFLSPRSLLGEDGAHAVASYTIVSAQKERLDHVKVETGYLLVLSLKLSQICFCGVWSYTIGSCTTHIIL